MKRILFLILIFLTACSAAEPAPASYFPTSTTPLQTPPEPDTVILTATADPAQNVPATSMPVEPGSISNAG